MKPKYFLAAGLGTVLLATILVRGLYVGDAAIYARMANRPEEFTTSPYGYRVLTPWLVHALPMPTTMGFVLVTLMAVFLTAVSLAAYCLYIGCHERTASRAVILWLSSLGAVFVISDFRSVDPIAYLGTVLAWYCVCRRRLLIAACLAPLITLDKEWGVLLVPALVVGGWQYRSSLRRREALVAAGGVLLTIGVWWIVRHWPGFGTTSSYANFYTWRRIRACLTVNVTEIVSDSLLAFGALWLLVPLGWMRASGTARLSLIYIVSARGRAAAFRHRWGENARFRFSMRGPARQPRIGSSAVTV